MFFWIDFPFFFVNMYLKCFEFNMFSFYCLKSVISLEIKKQKKITNNIRKYLTNKEHEFWILQWNTSFWSIFEMSKSMQGYLKKIFRYAILYFIEVKEKYIFWLMFPSSFMFNFLVVTNLVVKILNNNLLLISIPWLWYFLFQF